MEVLTQVARDVQRKYYGKFRGFVTDNADPEQRGRLRLRIPSVLGDGESGWALPCLPFGGLADQGLFLVPEIDAQVWVEFEEGDVSLPIWTGTFWQQSADTPEEAKLDEPTTRLLKTPSGHLVQFDDADGEERFYLSHPAGAEMEIDSAGTVTVTDAQGAVVKLDADAGEVTIEDANGNSLKMTSSGTTVEDANGNKIEMAAAGVTVEGQQVILKGTQVMLAGQGGEPIIKGQSFLTLFATHMHPHPMGPTGPPIPQGEMSSLSTKVMTS
ncbi:MAG: phage baseplate assembly protein V [Acidobacteriota bacterium]|nr:phage baseplate assembly protein V [Acidobacteriota bacterium]MDH3523211.1 phage baseplate assembly protein V [Acidobacteriota bacterium]